MHHLKLDSLSNLVGDPAPLINGAAADILLYLLSLNGRAFIFLLFCLLIVQFMKGPAAMRHFAATLSVFAVALLPLTSRLGPSFDIIIETSSMQNTVAGSVTAADNIPVPAAHEENPLTPGLFYLFCLAVYFLGFAIILTRVLLDNLKLFSLIKICQPVQQQSWLDTLEKHRLHFGVGRRIRLLHSDINASPSTWGVFRPVILLPRCALEWPDHLIDSTLLHELAHIKRYDWLVQQMARCIHALYWVNPLCRITINKIFSHAETACDDLAINAGVSNIDYAECLVDVAEQAVRRRRLGFPALAMAANDKHGPLSDRVLTILNLQHCRTPVTKMQIATCLSVFACILLPLASVRATLVERAIQPPGPVIFKEKLGRFTFPFEEAAPAPPIPVTLLPKGVMLGKEHHEKTPIPDEPEDRLDELKEIVEAGRFPPETVSVAMKDPYAAASGENITARNAEQAGAAPESGNESSEKDISTALHKVSQPLAGIPGNDNTAAEAESIVISPVPVDMVIPDYPSRALRRGIEGEVIVEYSIDERGKVIEAEILSAEPSTIFNRHVLKAIKNSIFNPRQIDGKPVPARGLVEKYVFVLES
ncbi:MAG TPA: M56 family metallopeptidase [Gammaproteobacteria bacterium]